MQGKNEKSFLRGITGLLLVGGLFGLFGADFWVITHIDWKSLEGATAAQVGGLISGATTSAMLLAKEFVGWLFGSSAGSERKTELLAQAPAVKP